MRKAVQGLTQEQTRVLIELAEGQSGSVRHRCHIRAERYYPYPHRYKLLNRGLCGAVLLPDLDLSAATVCRLIQLRLVDPHPRDANLDVITYSPSDAGREAVKRGRVYPADSEQEVFFADIR